MKSWGLGVKITLPETNMTSPLQMDVVGIRSGFLLGKTAYFSGKLAVSFREGNTNFHTTCLGWVVFVEICDL